MELKQLERTLLDGQDLYFLESVPYVYHCHHYNLFHDQTVDDAIGEDLGLRFRASAAQASVHQLLSRIAGARDLTGTTERMALATSLLPWMGHGRLVIDGLEATGEDLHYGHCWREKYGGSIKRLYPADAFAAGFSAAAVEIGRGLGPGSLSATETACIAMRSPSCKFELKELENDARQYACPDRKDYAKHSGAPISGQDENSIAKIAKGLQDFMRGVEGDDRGLIQAFGVYVTLHLAAYYNHTVYRTTHWVEKNAAGAVPAVEALFRESGHVCVFNTFGNIILSPEWEGMVGAPSGKPEEIVASCCAIARGLGFGRWTVGELEPGERFVLRTACNYEAPFYLSQYGTSAKPRCYILQGAALAMMVLAEKVDWLSRPKLTQDYYASLFRSGKLGWRAEETRCLARGDDMCEVVVTKD